MSIARLEISHIRNLQSATLLPHASLNLLVGPNGSGKTSVLEALHLLGLGRSFRSGRARRLVNDAENNGTVFASFMDEGQAGIQRGANGDTALRLDGRSQVTLAEMASRLPLVLLDPESMDLLDAGSKSRRALLDWGVFHVEHSFYRVWQRYQRALQQRNSLLKSVSISRLECAGWEREMAETAMLLHQYRQEYLAKWLPVWQVRIKEFLPQFDLTLDYQPGWDTEYSLESLLLEHWQKDRERGHTQSGPHRADLRVRLGTAAADEILSRGQKKLVVCALRLSQLSLLGNKKAILLLDDLASELDSSARERVIQYLAASQAQVFITGIEADAIEPALIRTGKTYKLFHVEHGTVQEDNRTT